MADDLGISPGQPEGANFPGEFIPSQRRECEDFHYAGGWEDQQVPMNIFGMVI